MQARRDLYVIRVAWRYDDARRNNRALQRRDSSPSDKTKEKQHDDRHSGAHHPIRMQERQNLAIVGAFGARTHVSVLSTCGSFSTGCAGCVSGTTLACAVPGLDMLRGGV